MLQKHWNAALFKFGTNVYPTKNSFITLCCILIRSLNEFTKTHIVADFIINFLSSVVGLLVLIQHCTSITSTTRDTIKIFKAFTLAIEPCIRQLCTWLTSRHIILRGCVISYRTLSLCYLYPTWKQVFSHKFLSFRHCELFISTFGHRQGSWTESQH